MSNAQERNNSKLWNLKFRELVAFKEEHGHLRIPRRTVEGRSNQLCGWMQKQRQQHRNKTLDCQRRQKLQDIGFSFVPDRKAEAWDDMFQELSAFKTKQGNFVISSPEKSTRRLYKWVDAQRTSYRKDTLPRSRKEKLNSIGFPCSPETFDAKWEGKFMELRKYKEDNGNLDVPKRSPRTADLYKWINGQRSRYRKEKLSEYRIDQLKSIGFSFEAQQAAKFDENFERMFEALAAFHKQHKHFSVPSEGETKSLHSWAHTQRELFRRSVLKHGRVEKLDSIGFDWSPSTASSKSLLEWEENFQRLKSFKEEHGHCLVPKKHPDTELARFVGNCRRQEGEGRLGSGEKARLVELGFAFDAKAVTSALAWESRYQELKEYYERTGSYESLNQNATHNTPYAGLAAWVSKQRSRKSQTAKSTEFAPLSPNQIEKLEAIDFDWRPSEKRDIQWNERLSRLKKYKLEHGDCMVPKCYEKDRKLANWLHKQRSEFRNETLRPDRKEKLENLGVVWNPGQSWAPDHDRSHLDAAWLLQYEKLCQFRDEFGHCLVSRMEYKELGAWVDDQRKYFKENRIAGERKKMLDEIGFVWETDIRDPEKSRRMKEWDSMFDKLVEFRTKHGHCRTPHPYRSDAEDNQLSIWVATQRKRKRSGRLQVERQRQLEAIDFVWELKEED